MRFLVFEHVHNARQSLKSNRVRSVLTTIGVTIGVASITAILSLSGGASKVVSDQIELLRGNIAIIRPGAATDNLTNITQSNQDFSTSSLSEDDIASIKKVNHVKSVAPLMKIGGAIRGDLLAPSNSPIVATEPSLATISNLKIKYGQFISDASDEHTVVLGPQLSINAFDMASSVGRTITIRGESFTIIGVLERMDNPLNYNSVDFDNAAIISFAAGKNLNKNIPQIQQIDVKVDMKENLATVVSDIDKQLSANHKGENDFSVLTGDKISQPTSQTFYTAAGLTTAIAAISLVVGGIGIMNIMLVTVAERTREIGIRKALGARNTDISSQFLIESVAISITGGIIGYFIGYILAFGISSFLTFDPIVTWDIFGIAILISIIMGMLFGLYPAFRAARKDPVDALHQYT